MFGVFSSFGKKTFAKYSGLPGDGGLAGVVHHGCEGEHQLRLVQGVQGVQEVQERMLSPDSHWEECD